MIDPKDMTDDEFVEFINANRERMDALMGNDRNVKTFLKDNAKKAKAKAEKVTDDTEEAFKKVFNAVFSTEVQKHIIGAGVELMLGFNAILKAFPVPEKAQGVVDKMSEFRQNAAEVYCSKNPDCPRKKAEAKKNTKKIELD